MTLAICTTESSLATVLQSYTRLRSICMCLCVYMGFMDLFLFTARCIVTCLVTCTGVLHKNGDAV